MLLSNNNQMTLDCFGSELDEETGEAKPTCDTVVLEEEYKDQPSIWHSAMYLKQVDDDARLHWLASVPMIEMLCANSSGSGKSCSRVNHQRIPDPERLWW
jgi:hypothetical protein